MNRNDLHDRLTHYLDDMDAAITFGLADPRSPSGLLAERSATAAQTYALAAQAVAAALAVAGPEQNEETNR